VSYRGPSYSLGFREDERRLAETLSPSRLPKGPPVTECVDEVGSLGQEAGAQGVL